MLSIFTDTSVWNTGETGDINAQKGCTLKQQFLTSLEFEKLKILLAPQNKFI